MHRIGQGSALLFIHGFGFDHRVFLPLISVLSKRFQCLLVDLPGCGQSEFEDYSLTSLVAKLASKLNKPCDVIGWSLGGTIALKLAADYPQKVAKLVLLGCNPQFVETAHWQGMSEVAFEQFKTRCYNNPIKMMRYFAQMQLGKTRSKDPLVADLKNLVSDKLESKAVTTALDILATKLKTWLDLSTLSLPTLWIFGEDDQLVPVAVAQHIKARCLAAEVSVFPQCGHVMFLENQSLFIEKVEQFL